MHERHAPPMKAFPRTLLPSLTFPGIDLRVIGKLIGRTIVLEEHDTHAPSPQWCVARMGWIVRLDFGQSERRSLNLAEIRVDHGLCTS